MYKAGNCAAWTSPKDQNTATDCWRVGQYRSQNCRNRFDQGRLKIRDRVRNYNRGGSLIVMKVSVGTKKQYLLISGKMRSKGPVLCEVTEISLAEVYHSASNERRIAV